VFQDGRVVIWRTDDSDGKWRPNIIREGDVPIYNVSWSPNGAVLAVASADNKVNLNSMQFENVLGFFVPIAYSRRMGADIRPVC
jgi:WD40 repeat protein